MKKIAIRMTEAVLLMLALAFMVPPVGSRESLEYLGNPYLISISIALFFGSRLLRGGTSKEGIAIALVEALFFAAFHYVFVIAIRLLCS